VESLPLHGILPPHLHRLPRIQVSQLPPGPRLFIEQLTLSTRPCELGWSVAVWFPYLLWERSKTLGLLGGLCKQPYPPPSLAISFNSDIFDFFTLLQWFVCELLTPFSLELGSNMLTWVQQFNISLRIKLCSFRIHIIPVVDGPDQLWVVLKLKTLSNPCST
jgi:hypothetical protein